MLSGFKNMLFGFRICCPALKICCSALKYAVWINTAAANGKGYQLSTCNPSGLQQRHLSSAAASQHQVHSSICSQNEGTSCEGLLAPTSTRKVTYSTTLARGATITKASLVEVTLPWTSLVVSSSPPQSSSY